MRFPRRVLLAMLLLMPAAGQAQDAETAASLQSQLRAWFASWPRMTPSRPEPPLTVRVENDHYRIEWPLAASADHSGNDFTVRLRSQDGGRWLLESPRLEPSTIELTLPQTPAPAGKEASNGPTRMSITLGSQSGRAEFDPSFATPSMLALAVSDVETVTATGNIRQQQHFDHYVLNGQMSPAAGGRVDVESDTSAGGWRGSAQTPTGGAFAYSARDMHGDLYLRGVSRRAAPGITDAIAAIVPLLPSQTEAGHPVDPARQALLRRGFRTVVEALRDSLASLALNDTINYLHVRGGEGKDVAIRRVAITMRGKAPNDRLHASWDLTLDGITASHVLPDLADLLPAGISLRPSVTGINLTRLKQLGLDETADTPDHAKLAAESAALWNDPTARFGIESAVVTLGPARLEGSGQMHFVAPGEPEVLAQVSATGLDALLAKAASKPALQRALPVLLILRGMGRPDGKRLVWDIVAHKGQILVNGLDMKMFGAAAGGIRQMPGRAR